MGAGSRNQINPALGGVYLFLQEVLTTVVGHDLNLNIFLQKYRATLQFIKSIAATSRVQILLPRTECNEEVPLGRNQISVPQVLYQTKRGPFSRRSLFLLLGSKRCPTWTRAKRIR